MITAILTATLITQVVAAGSETTLADVHTGGVRQVSIRLQHGTFGVSRLEQLSRAQLAGKRGKDFMEVWFYGDTGGAPLPQPDHMDYDTWLRLHNECARAGNEIGELVSIGRDAVLRVRDASGSVTREVLTGSDPLIFDTGGERYEVLYFAFSAPGPYILQKVDVFLKTTATLSRESGMKLLQRFTPVFPDLKVNVYVRNDPWFIFEPNYPFLNPFVEGAIPPTFDQYEQGKTLRCGSWPGPPSCTLQ
jgi:hypothetical protein